jgi:hypothetical protein
MTMKKTVDIVFDGPPGPEAGRFVEVEDMDGASISLGEWVKREDGYWVLRIPDPRPDTAELHPDGDGSLVDHVDGPPVRPKL